MRIAVHKNRIAVRIIPMNMIDGSLWIIVWLPRSGIDVAPVQPKALIATDRINPFSWVIRIRWITSWKKAFTMGKFTNLGSGPSSEFVRRDFGALHGLRLF
ncbi:MAG TPA: hypothetical protein VFC78_13160 [Tepidisphaeraceae bacterium]|nr:hypothetical protein [Tepidisphaeraceae bacterium]